MFLQTQKLRISSLLERAANGQIQLPDFLRDETTLEVVDEEELTV